MFNTGVTLMVQIVWSTLAFLGLLIIYLVQPTPVKSLREPSADADCRKRLGLAKTLEAQAPKTGKKYVVLGIGNVGLTIVEALIMRGEKDVVGFDVAKPRRSPGKNFKLVQGDVTKYEEVLAALKGADVVYATFALIRYHERLPHEYATSHAVNVQGTENVLRACVEQNVPLLIQTSTSHVVITAALDNKHGMDESQIYCTEQTAMNHYAWTKSQAEQLVLAANGKPLKNGKGALLTVALRPCSGIFGAGDVLIAEGTLKALHAKGTEMVVAHGSIDWIMCEDLVYAELLCERKLAENPAAIGGQAFNVCPGDPIGGWDFNQAIKYYYEKETGRKTTLTAAPLRMLYTIATFVELYHSLSKKKVSGDLGKLTPSMLDCAKLTYSFNGGKARKLLGYEPIYTFDEGAHRVVLQWLETNATNGEKSS